MKRPLAGPFHASPYGLSTCEQSHCFKHTSRAAEVKGFFLPSFPETQKRVYQREPSLSTSFFHYLLMLQHLGGLGVASSVVI